MKILHFKHNLEAELIRDFLKWQSPSQRVPEMEENPSALRINASGKPAVIAADGKVIARGFQQLVEHWNREGLWLL